MSDVRWDAKLLLTPIIGLVYSDSFAEQAVTLYLSSGKEMRIYIVGCLLLTLTASVLPQFTLLADRLKTLTSGSSAEASATSELASSATGVEARGLAEAGFLRQSGDDRGGGDTVDSAYGGSSAGSASSVTPGTIVCFHCCARLAPGQAWSADPLHIHRTASPNCYYARLADLVRTHGAAADRLGVSGDAKRYERALRKLGADLGAGGIPLAAAFGYDARSMAVWATRRFMRCNGACPTRAGDLLATAHESEGLFPEQLLAAVDIQRLLDLLDLSQRGH